MENYLNIHYTYNTILHALHKIIHLVVVVVVVGGGAGGAGGRGLWVVNGLEPPVMGGGKTASKIELMFSCSILSLPFVMFIKK